VKKLIRNIFRNIRHGIEFVEDRVAWNLAALRSRQPRIRQIWTGRHSLAGARRVAVLVHFSRRGAFLRYFHYMVEQLERCGFAVIIVSNSKKLDVEAVEALLPHCALVLHRHNVGYDFGAWRDGILQIPDLAVLDQLLITNDSVFGPLYDLETVLQRLDPATGDVWGITESFDTRYHLQSYFLLFHSAVLQASKFRKFWETMRYVEAKRVVIFKYEIGLSQTLLKAGFRLRALNPYRQLAGAKLAKSLEGRTEPHWLTDDHTAHVLQTISLGYPLNPTHYFWDSLVVDFGCPFIKRDLLEKNPVGIPMLSAWRTALAGVSNYPLELIEEYLQEASRGKVY
jgi:lipopolysaccharide biosynthesis protein